MALRNDVDKVNRGLTSVEVEKIKEIGKTGESYEKLAQELEKQFPLKEENLDYFIVI